MSYGAGMDDCVLILHMDRKDHILMNYAQQIDRLPIFEQEAVALFVSKGSFFPTITMNLKKITILKVSLVSISSPSLSVKIQIMDGKGVKAKHCWALSTNFLFSKVC